MSRLNGDGQSQWPPWGESGTEDCEEAGPAAAVSLGSSLGESLTSIAFKGEGNEMLLI